MLVLAIFMSAVWITIAYEKPRALIFAGRLWDWDWSRDSFRRTMQALKVDPGSGVRPNTDSGSVPSLNPGT